MNNSPPGDLTSSEFIVWLFRGRCVKCNEDGIEVNEIEPRSRSRESILNWKNKVLMCRKCHDEYHAFGVNQDAIDALKKRREEFLTGIGRELYIK